MRDMSQIVKALRNHGIKHFYTTLPMDDPNEFFLQLIIELSLHSITVITDPADGVDDMTVWFTQHASHRGLLGCSCSEVSAATVNQYLDSLENQ